MLTHAERKTWAEHRGACSQESSFSNLADMEFVFRVKLDFRHRLIFGGIEGRHRRFRRAEFPEVAAGVGQAEVVGVGRPIAPGLLYASVAAATAASRRPWSRSSCARTLSASA